MEILLISDKAPWPANSGGAFATGAFTRQLLRSGHHVTVACYHTKKHPYINSNSLTGEKENLSIVPVKVRSSISIAGLLFNLLFSGLPYDIGRYRTQSFRRVLKELLSAANYDIVQFEGLKVCLHIDLVKKHCDSRLVYRAHNIESNLWQKRATIANNALAGWYYRKLANRTLAFEQEVYKKITGLIAISDEDRLGIQHLYSGKSVTILPVSEDLTEAYTFSDRHKLKNSLLFLGSLDWQPNLNGLEWFLKKVFPLIRDKNKNIKLRVAGRGASRNTIRLIEKSGALYQGSPEDSVSFLKSGSVLIVPLFASSGIRIKIIEALAQGLDVISTFEGAAGLPDEIKAIIKIEEAAESFARQVLKLTERNSTYSREELARMELVKSFFGKFAGINKINEFYSDIVNDS
ncbi:MAG: glycosyltransferase family 4 protein [Marinilabiliaceae bacterium]|jgi:glycosyltransferase involved in cell wall biosynthesis|nr:glycosyltransferase family 4 protein [Marinilabiliaceae bacterium]